MQEKLKGLATSHHLPEQKKIWPQVPSAMQPSNWQQLERHELDEKGSSAVCNNWHQDYNVIVSKVELT